MIAAVTTVKDEADIIGCTVRHMLAQGVDQVWVMDWQSTDGTRDSLADLPVTVVDGSPLPFYWANQGSYIDRLAALANEHGAEWIVPFDADEYWIGTYGRTVAEALNECEAYRTLARVYQYADFDHQSRYVYPWEKVAYRYRPQARVMAGNHNILGMNEPHVEDVLMVHELKFRGFDHFVRKCTRQVPWDEVQGIRPDAPDFGLVIGGERTVFSEESFERLQSHWDWLHSDVINQPIPSEFRP